MSPVLQRMISTKTNEYFASLIKGRRFWSYVTPIQLIFHEIAAVFSTFSNSFCYPSYVYVNYVMKLNWNRF